jgi:hypothetical protein
MDAKGPIPTGNTGGGQSFRPTNAFEIVVLQRVLVGLNVHNVGPA